MKRVVGVDIGGSKILAALAVGDGPTLELAETVRIPTEPEKGGEVLGRICLAIDRVLEEAGLGREDIAAIGAAPPGPVDARRGIVVACANIPSLAGADLRRHLGERYGVPVGVDNDAHAAALAEARSGAGRGYEDFIYVSLGTGIGGGIIVGGKLYRGADGAAGELSHIVFPGAGELHLLASGKALRSIFGIGAEELGARCDSGDARAKEALDHLVRYIGVGIADAVTLLNPEAVVIGGGLCKLGDRLLRPLESEIRRNAYSVGASTFEFVRAEYGESAGAIGAAYLGLACAGG